MLPFDVHILTRYRRGSSQKYPDIIIEGYVIHNRLDKSYF